MAVVAIEDVFALPAPQTEESHVGIIRNHTFVAPQIAPALENVIGEFRAITTIIEFTVFCIVSIEAECVFGIEEVVALRVLTVAQEHVFMWEGESPLLKAGPKFLNDLI
jgi:hypothetical protein